MKLFAFTCLLAVALAEHKTEQQSSSEESVNVSQEKFKKIEKLATISSEEIIGTPYCKDTMKNIPEVASSSISSSEEFADVSTENKKEQIQQKLKFLQYLQALYQHPVVMNPWNQVQTRPYPIAFPTLDRGQISTIKDIVKKTSDMESREILTKKTKMDEVQKIFQNLLNKIQEYYHKVFQPPKPESDDHSLKVLIPWNAPLRY